jgi:hypothetical protein
MTLRITVILLLALTPLVSLAQPSSVTANAPVINFKLPGLNDEGLRTSLLRGNEARYVNASQIDLVGMQYTIFAEGSPTKVDTTLLAPTASVFIINNKIKVHGEEGMRLINDDLDVSGEKWTYEHAGKNDPNPRKITIERNVRVVFRLAEMKDILK